MFKRNKGFAMLPLLALLALALSACAQTLPETGGEPTEAVVEEATTMEDITAELEATGAEVADAGTIQQPFFDVEGQILEVNGQQVQFFEFPTAEIAQQVAATISPAGDVIGDVTAQFIDTPHFFQQGRVIALFIGQDQATIDLLTGALGDPIAGPIQ